MADILKKTLWDKKLLGGNKRYVEWSTDSGYVTDYVEVIYVDGLAKYLYYETGQEYRPKGGSFVYYDQSGRKGFFGGGGCDAYVSAYQYYHLGTQASTCKALNVNVGENATVTFTNSNLASVYHRTAWQTWNGDAWETVAWTESGANVDNETCAMDNNFAGKFPNSKTFTVQCVVYTYNDATQWANWGDIIGYNTCTFTVTIPSSTAPTSDITIAYNSTYFGYLTGISNVQFKAGTITAAYGATITWKITAQDGTVCASGTGTAFQDTYVGSSTAGSRTYTLTYTDSRGYSGSVQSADIWFTAYSAPTISMAVSRQSGDNATALTGTVTFTHTVLTKWNAATETVDANKATVTIYYSTDGVNYSSTIGHGDISNVYQSIATATFTSASIFGLSTAYYIKAIVSDNVGYSASFVTRLPPASAFLHLTRNSVGVGSYTTAENQVYINDGWSLYTHGKEILDLIHPVGSIYSSTDPTDPSELFGGRWEQITDSTWRRIS